jgi:hypothetical protein
VPVTPRVNKSLDWGCCGDRITATPVVKSHKGSQIPHDRLVTVIRLLYALTLLMVISSLPNLLTAWYSALYCPSNYSDINANVFENLIKHFKRAHELMLHNISTGYATASENRVMAANKKMRIPSAFYRLGLLYSFLNFPNIKHIASLYNRSTAYLARMKINHRKSILHSLFKCIKFPQRSQQATSDKGPSTSIRGENYESDTLLIATAPGIRSFMDSMEERSQRNADECLA